MSFTDEELEEIHRIAKEEARAEIANYIESTFGVPPTKEGD